MVFALSQNRVVVCPVNFCNHWSFHIHCAHITHRDRHEYLECWCPETEGNTDLPELQHNWTLRMDRISDAAIVPLKAKWQPDLDVLNVELHLFAGLAFAYEARASDIANEWLPNQPIKQIIRPVSSTFWLYREILPYGEDCPVISPAAVRDRFRDKLSLLHDRYNDRPFKLNQHLPINPIAPICFYPGSKLITITLVE